MRLKDKSALVIGGTSGIGRSIVELFIREGAVVTFTGRRRELGNQIVREFERKRAMITYRQVDVLELASVRDVIRETAARQERLDILVNNVGAIIPGTILDTDEAEYETMFDINVKPTFFATKWAAELMVAQRSGSIVNTASVSGIRGLIKRAAYCGTKGAVIQVSKAAALDLAPFGVRVNCISPGAVDTELLRSARFGNVPNQNELLAELGEQQPLGRVGYTEDIAWAVLYLASDESRWVTGTNMVVDGGVTA